MSEGLSKKAVQHRGFAADVKCGLVPLPGGV
jgi:hypothetical protein